MRTWKLQPGPQHRYLPGQIIEVSGEQKRSSDCWALGAITLASGFQGDATIPFILECGEIEIFLRVL